MTLTEEEKKKIEEEENYRAQVRSKTPQQIIVVKKIKNPTTAGALVFFFNGFGWLYLSAWGNFGLYFLIQGILFFISFALAGENGAVGFMLLLMFVWHIANVFWASSTAKKMSE